MTAHWPPPRHDELPAGGWVWSDFSLPVFDFACILRAADLMPANEDEYWEKPWKWDPEHQAWIAAGEPAPPDAAGAPAALAWRRFLRDAANH
ncbi:MAG: hypothetical protein O2892_07785 [Actinomycetota bacterium]|nr:hypothetical protein [Actinomycetota bacterium]MDA2948930.1 hypothetical protein [Actinomycetota bacterium]